MKPEVKRQIIVYLEGQVKFLEREVDKYTRDRDLRPELYNNLEKAHKSLIRDIKQALKEIEEKIK